MTATRRVVVEPASGPAYDVTIGEGVAAGFAGRIGGVLGTEPGRVFMVIDTGVPGAWAGAVADSFEQQGIAVGRHAITPSESVKSLETLRGVLEAMAGFRLERREPVIAVGGGIVGDVAGFAAASYRRGTPVIQCPTTLLAAVDASVGGKTGVNLTVPGPDGKPALLKNMVGAFHQPRAVLADVTAFRSLPARELRSGLAECVKHGMIAADWGDAGLFEWMRASAESVVSGDAGVTAECVERNVAVKARVVAADEREESDTGGRALLNLGHTYAHAMETLGGLAVSGPDGGTLAPPLLHGEAVGLGLIAAAACSAAMGRVPGGYTDEVAEAVRGCGLPTSVIGLPDDEALLGRMLDDKKTAGGRLRLTLLREPGRGELVADPPVEAVRAGWAAVRGTI